MFMYPVDDEIALALPRPAVDGPALFALVAADREGIGRFLPWARALTDAAAEQAFLTLMLEQFGAGRSANLLVYAAGAPVGMISFNGYDEDGLSADIGYWLGAAYRGRGIMTRAVAAMCTLGFTDYGRNKLVIRAAVDNAASNGVAARAGFHLDGTLRDGVRLADGFHDENEWSLLRREWAAARG
ncbi:GNAT family N-acetyltransferase [Lacticaseibacillus absianus]|uniref:GNAT family N-acetyltransferase n=1 Tax=Lacticaseibacillus absianus TaxID=2729623 RepID=UPI0015CA130D|nr:GNAT family protein [Lacticaseibacillus absianus]